MLRVIEFSGCGWLIAVAVGCASAARQPGPDPKQRENQQPRAIVEWVFNVPDALELQWRLFPAAVPGWVTAGAVADGRVLLLCDLGAGTENTRPSRAYVLNLDKGSVIKRIVGPAHGDHYTWAITPRLLYFRIDGEQKMVAFDVDRGVFNGHPPSPDPQDILVERTGPRDTRLDSGFSAAPSDSERVQVIIWDLGKHRQLNVRQELPGGTAEFVLKWQGRTGEARTQTLCHFPVRWGQASEPRLLMNDDRRLLFTWGQHVICVDTRGLEQAPASQTPASE